MNINNNIVINKSKYFNNNICNTNYIKNLDISFNYNNIVQYKNYSNLTKKQIYSLFVNNITTPNNNINNINNINNNFNIKNNKNSTKIINLYNNIFNNPNNPNIKYQDISQSLYCQKTILEDFPNNDVRKYLNINNYKWFLNPDQKFQNSHLTVRKKYPQLFDGTNIHGYTDNNYNLLKKFTYNLNFKHFTKPQLYSYLANSTNKKNPFFGSYINNPFGCKK
jgi:hypothetical protein